MIRGWAPRELPGNSWPQAEVSGAYVEQKSDLLIYWLTGSVEMEILLLLISLVC
jgi:hypothetical protein